MPRSTYGFSPYYQSAKAEQAEAFREGVRALIADEPKVKFVLVGGQLVRA